MRKRTETSDTKLRTRAWDRTPEATAYRNRYAEEHYDRVTLALPAGYREKLDRAATETGISRTALIVRAIDAYLETK